MHNKKKWRLKGLVAIALAAAFLVVTTQLLAPRTQWWYPFVASVFSDHYTTGPFAMTSNTREDNPVWTELAAFNRAQARMTYAMTRGSASTPIAWLLPESEWPDKPALSFFELHPNQNESPISRTLVANALDYDRISRANLLNAEVTNGELLVGQGRYQALLISDLHTASPDLLRTILSIAELGIPVITLGALPQRAPGWAEHSRRDAEVAELTTALAARTKRLPDHATLPGALAATGLLPLLSPAQASDGLLRISQRALKNGQLLLLFNDSEQSVTRQYQTRDPYQKIELLNPEDGRITVLCEAPDASCQALAVSIPAGRSRLLRLSRAGENTSTTDWDTEQWHNPARALHPFIRWWWPGNAVEPEELVRELRSIAAAGFGGVEVQTLTIGLTYTELNDKEEQIYQVGTPAFFNNLRTVFNEAGKLGLTVDLTMGSGWSSGGPFIDEHPEQQLLQSTMDVSGPQHLRSPLPAAQQPGYVTPSNWVIANTIGEFDANARREAVVAARLDTSTSPATLSDFIDLGSHVSDDQLQWSVPEGNYRIFTLYQNATAHNLVASAYPGALQRSRVLDHLNRGGAEEYIHDLGEPWLNALAPHKPRAFFVDSFELIGELPWSSGFRQQFQQLHGYDVTPYLPLLFKHRGESKYVNVVIPPQPAYATTDDMAERVREDYEATREYLFQEAFIRPLKNWTADQGIALRLQAHGGYGNYLDSYQIADIPEAEGLFAGGSFDFLKLASSAGHIAGRQEISSESFITMSLNFNRLDIDDYYYLAGNAYAAGINRTVTHGYAYHFPLGR